MNTTFTIEQITPELTWEIRQRELYPDFPLSEIKLKEDYYGIHLGLFTDNKLVSIVSLFEKDSSTSQLRKFATLKEYQGKGFGKTLLASAMDLVKQQGKSLIWCNVRVSAIGFYKKFGFKETDKAFTRKGIDYIIMEKELTPKA